MFISSFFLLLMISFIMTYFQTLLAYYNMMIILFIILSKMNWKFYCFNSVYYYVDNMSSLLIILTFIIILFMIMMNYKLKNKSYLFFHLLLFFSLIQCFLMNNLLFFYVFFEFSLVPLALFIMNKGASIERFKALMYMLLYTIFSSLIFLMFYLLFIKNNNFNSMCSMLKIYFFFKLESKLSLMMFFIFLVKMPMFSLHFWLPKAHVESPVEGSMILASILLKLGGFGINRLFMLLNMEYIKLTMMFMMIYSLYGALLASFICLRQIDIKLMIAYSSISHMGLLMGGLFSLKKIGMTGMISMMMAHGFCSSALFFLANLFYERCKSRNLFFFKGMLYSFPFLMSYWLIFSIFNMGAPFSLNFFSELFLIISILSKSMMFFIYIIFIMFMTVVYSLNMYLRVAQGITWKMKFFKKESHLDYLILFMHIYFMMIFLFKMSFFFI